MSDCLLNNMQVNGDGVITRLRQQIDELNFNKIVSDSMVAELLQTNQELSNKIEELENTVKLLEENVKTAKQAKAN